MYIVCNFTFFVECIRTIAGQENTQTQTDVAPTSLEYFSTPLCKCESVYNMFPLKYIFIYMTVLYVILNI